MQQTYDKLAKYYDGAFAPLEQFFLARLRAETLSHLPANAKILEIGAGTGANFRFYPTCDHAIASEISLKMIDIAKDKANDIELVQANAEHLPFPANHFDGAFATLVFCSVPSPETAFGEVIRVLKPGGRFVLLEHVRPDGVLGYAFDLLNVLTVAVVNDHFNRRTARTVEKAGLRLVSVKKILFGIVNLIVCEVDKYHED